MASENEQFDEVELSETSLKLRGKPAEVVATLLGSFSRPAEAIGSMLTDVVDVAGAPLHWAAERIRAWREGNIATVAERTAEILDERKIAPKPLSPSFAVQAIAGAAEAYDPSLQEMWAQLLATSIADESQQRRIFVRMLSDLEPLDARLLARMATSPPDEHHAWDVTGGWPDIVSDFDFPGQQSYLVLFSLGLCRSTQTQAGPGEHPLLTPLGVAFCAAVGAQSVEAGSGQA